MAPTAGQVIRATGEWINHPKHGEQFTIVQYTTMVPATAAGIEKYLGSGLIKGISPVMAKRIVKFFGEKTLDIIEQNCERLSKVDGIGDKRVKMIWKAWNDQKAIREVMVFLQGHGVSPAYATKIFRQYGDNSIEVVKENPYRLAMDIFGIGFITAGRIAEGLGFVKDSEVRAEAGVIYVLHQISDEGHVYYPQELNQLPSVGPGSVLGYIIESGAVPGDHVRGPVPIIEHGKRLHKKAYCNNPTVVMLINALVSSVYPL